MSKVVELCGEYPQDFEKVDISSIPNYVFENDTNYAARQLFDEEENIVTVNSFIECEHYVSGGWGFSPLKNMQYNELQLIDFLTYTVIFFLFLSYSKNIFRKLLKK